MSKFDISALELNDEGTVTIFDASGDNELLVEGQPVTITVYGQGSKQYVIAKHKLDNANTLMMTSLLQKKASNANRAEEATKNAAEFLASVTKMLNNLPIEGGALALYSNPKLKYITDQVDKYLGEAANFMPSLSVK